MSKDGYITIRIPQEYDELIQKYIRKCRKDLLLLGTLSRAGVVKKALYELFKKEGIIKENPNTVTPF